MHFLGEYKWHVMVHCKHSRLAKSAERPISEWQRGHSPDVFFFPPFWWRILSKGFTESRARLDSWKTMQQGIGFVLPFVPLHSQVSVFFSPLSLIVFARGQHYSLSILNVSSVAGSASTMSGSLSMCRPSRVSGSIFSSSRGNCVSGSKLTSPTPANELVSSLERLGGDSPVTEICDIGERSETLARQGRRGHLQLKNTLGCFTFTSQKIGAEKRHKTR